MVNHVQAIYSTGGYFTTKCDLRGDCDVVIQIKVGGKVVNQTSPIKAEHFDANFIYRSPKKIRNDTIIEFIAWDDDGENQTQTMLHFEATIQWFIKTPILTKKKNNIPEKGENFFETRTIWIDEYAIDDEV